MYVLNCNAQGRPPTRDLGSLTKQENQRYLEASSVLVERDVRLFATANRFSLTGTVLARQQSSSRLDASRPATPGDVVFTDVPRSRPVILAELPPAVHNQRPVFGGEHKQSQYIRNPRRSVESRIQALKEVTSRNRVDSTMMCSSSRQTAHYLR